MYHLSEKRPLAYAGKTWPAIKNPEDAVNLCCNLFPVARESYVIMFLDTRHNLIDSPYTVSIGTLNAALVHPREVFIEAISRGSAALITMHNHPSGNVQPSADDTTLAERITLAGELLGIHVLDHLIINPKTLDFYSHAMQDVSNAQNGKAQQC